MTNLMRSCWAAIAASALVLSAPATAQEVVTPQPSAMEATAAQPSDIVTDAEMESARGGIVWAVFVGPALTGAGVVIRTCARQTDSCARGAYALFSSGAAARRFVCRRWGRLC